MGVMTLADFQTDILSAMGNRGTGNPTLTRWINYAYFDIVSSVDFEANDEEDTTQSTSIGSNSINIPASLLVIKLVRNTTGDNLLQWVPKNEYHRLSQAVTGSPVKWTRHKDKILLHPVPNAILATKIVYKKVPTKLSGNTDVTVIPEIWDVLIFILGTAYGFLTVGEEARSQAWLSRAAVYVQARMTEASMNNSLASIGLAKAPITGANPGMNP